jgi:Arabinose-binding domain of AraC transcription regulator, N-term
MRSVPQSEVADRPFLWTRGVAASETLRYLDKNGVDVGAILSKAQPSRSQLSQDSGGISVASQHRFLEFAAVETNDSLLGLHVAAEMDLRDVGILFYLAAASATVAEARDDPECASLRKPTTCPMELYHANGWTDGLPIVPPTRDAVVACLELAVADPAQLVGVEPVRGVAVTAEKLAINAVMAGCLPTHFLVVLACFAAMLRPEFLLHGATASTGAARFWLH